MNKDKEKEKGSQEHSPDVEYVYDDDFETLFAEGVTVNVSPRCGNLLFYKDKHILEKGEDEPSQMKKIERKVIAEVKLSPKMFILLKKTMNTTIKKMKENKKKENLKGKRSVEDLTNEMYL